MESRKLRELLQLYWAGETSMEEEEYILHHAHHIEVQEDKDYFMGLRQARSVQIPNQIQIDEVVKVRRLYPPWLKVAAAIALVIAIGATLFWNPTESKNNTMATQHETFEDPELAIKQTEKALEFVFNKMKNGQNESAQQFKKIESLRIIL